MSNASFDVLMVMFVIWYWVETKGLTLEEVDERFDGIKHSPVPDLEELKSGKAKVEFVLEAPETVAHAQSVKVEKKE
jgi:hypothetical protein